jgi:hypothetical protein
MKFLQTFALAVSLFLVLGTTAQASAITATIFNSFPAPPGYGAVYAIDGNVLTDYASQGGGNGTFLVFEFSQPYSVNEVDVTDRTSSGGANGSSARGLYDFVTSYELIFSPDASFTTTQTVIVNNPLPSGPIAGPYPLADFQTTASIPDFEAQFVEYRVLAYNPASSTGNTGLAEITFYGNPVPEPFSFAMVGSAFAMLGLIAKRRHSRNL